MGILVYLQEVGTRFLSLPASLIPYATMRLTTIICAISHYKIQFWFRSTYLSLLSSLFFSFPFLYIFSVFLFFTNFFHFFFLFSLFYSFLFSRFPSFLFLPFSLFFLFQLFSLFIFNAEFLFNFLFLLLILLIISSHFRISTFLFIY